MKLEAFRLERYLTRYEYTTSYLLCPSSCESLELGDLLALDPGAQEQLSTLWLGYTEPLGHPDLRQAVTLLYEDISADQVLVHAGAEEAIFNFMNVALDPGDHVVVHAPHYQSLSEVARGIGAEVTEWPARPGGSWELDLAFLKNALTATTKVVVVNFPHNPTGFLPSLDFVHQLSELSQRHGFVIFADEIYRGLEHDPELRLPAMAEINDRAVSVGVMSKTYGLAGLRIGWIVTHNAELYQAMAAFKDYTTICNSAPSEFLATLALRHFESIAERNLQIIRANLDLLDPFFGAHQDLFDWHRPNAGSIAFPSLRRGRVDDFCRGALERQEVLLLPGTLYDESFNAFRIGFGRKNLPEALPRLEAFVQQTWRPELASR